MAASLENVVTQRGKPATASSQKSIRVWNISGTSRGTLRHAQRVESLETLRYELVSEERLDHLLRLITQMSLVVRRRE